jgi:N-sulfoglucosamine sulfohydrolase
MSDRPNIVYIHSHDTGRYIQPYGYAIPTPRMQRLAEEGLLFRQAFCAAPTCSPSRAALLTGQSAHSSGMTGLAHRGFSLHDYGQHIVHTLRRAGYSSALAGIQHVARDAAVIGYDRVLKAESRRVEDVAPAAADYLRQAPGQPFFLSVGFFETHRYQPGKLFSQEGPQGDPRYVRPPAPLPDTPETRQDMADFMAAAAIYDRGVGIVLDALEENGLAENTLVICTTDHGIAFPGMKCNLTDHGIGVMLILRGPFDFGCPIRAQDRPGGFSGGQVHDAMVSQIDLYPTLCELLDVEPPAWLQGRSLLPLVRADAPEVHDAIFSEISYHGCYDPQRAVRTRRWKYIRGFYNGPRPGDMNCDGSASKDLWVEHGWRHRYPAQEQLYDLLFDPNEANNLAADPDHAEVLHEMRERLRRWMEATDDPLLAGPVPAPQGARINDPPQI